MGYRLNISRYKNDKESLFYRTKLYGYFYGTKLYGYVDNKKLLSYNYLVQIGKLEGDECFCYGASNDIELNYEEFKIFCTLYDNDLFNYFVIYNWSPNDFLELPEIKKLFKMKLDKYYISWC